jgi:hypothetical protein
VNTSSTPAQSLFLTQGGPGAAAMIRLRLVHPERGLASPRTALVLICLTWLPLFVLSTLQGYLFSGARIPFLFDIAVHARFLLAAPILLLAEVPIGLRLRDMVRQFTDAGLVRREDTSRFSEIMLDSQAIRDSRIAEVAVFALAYVSTYLNFSQLNLQKGNIWYTPGESGHLSWAGYWYLFVGLPLFQFLIFRWIYRMYIWSRFLWKTSKLDLRLSAAHPDGAGGLGFLGKSLTPFGTIMFAMSVVVSGAIASRIIFAGAKLDSFAASYIALLVIAILIFAGPLLVFSPKLMQLKYKGTLQYSLLANRYTQLFGQKWTAAEPGSGDESFLGSGDIQSLADMGNSFELVHKTRVLPAEISDLVMLAIPAIIPALPLLTTVMPLTDILKGLLRLVA